MDFWAASLAWWAWSTATASSTWNNKTLNGSLHTENFTLNPFKLHDKLNRLVCSLSPPLWRCNTATSANLEEQTSKMSKFKGENNLSQQASRDISNRLAINWPLSATTQVTPACEEARSCRSPVAYRWSCLPDWGACSGSGETDAHLKKNSYQQTL